MKIIIKTKNREVTISNFFDFYSLPFFIEPQQSVDVDMMFIQAEFPYYEDKKLGATIIGLPYNGSEVRFSQKIKFHFNLNKSENVFNFVYTRTIERTNLSLFKIEIFIKDLIFNVLV